MMHTHKKRIGPRPLCIHTGLLQGPATQYKNFAQNNFIPYGENDCIKIIRGIQAYQGSTYFPQKPAVKAVYEYKGMRLLSPEVQSSSDKRVQYTHSILIIPSLINNAEIFNLNSERSFIVWLQQNGVEVFLLDWGELNNTNPDITMENMVAQDLPHMIDAARKSTQNQLDILGYCMGGTLLLGAMQFTKEPLGKLILLAAPWDFHAADTGFFKSVRAWSPFALEAIKHKGYLPSLWVEALFAMLDMSKAGSKFKEFAEIDSSSERARLFIDVEDWLGSGCDIPSAIAQYCIQEWFAGNVTSQNIWEIAGQKIDLSSYENDVLIIASEKDKITPYECASGAAKHFVNADVTIMKKECGHISYIAGQNAVASIWEPFLEWIRRA